MSPPSSLKAGSSPLTRGKLLLRGCGCGGIGLIPAHAGKTSGVSTTSRAPWAHPRSRGENGRGGDGDWPQGGSSPLTRGKPSAAITPTPAPRLIPAHAGKTTPHRPAGQTQSAHPRSRGENALAAVFGNGVKGSSPLTRGKRPVSGSGSSSSGLIPAHAGKTWTAYCPIPSKRAHPRSRGENHPIPANWSAQWGSSPLTRGKLAVRDHLTELVRLIPAHAGKTCCSIMWGRNFPAHPRSRGENKPVWPDMSEAEGSSPLTRGKLRQSRASGLASGLIPAHAGKTRSVQREQNA